MPALSHGEPAPSRRSRRHGRLLAASLLPLSLLLASCSTAPPDQTATTTPTPTNGATGTTTGGNTTGGSVAAQFEQPRKAEGELNIMIITNGISPFWDPMVVGMQKAAAEVGCKADWAGPQNSTVAEQRRLVEDAVAKGVDGIAISSIEDKSSVPIIELAASKGIPVITFDSDSPSSKRIAYIGTNNYRAGEAAGNAAVKLLPSGGKFVGFVGNISAPNAQQRRDGFVAAAKAGNIELTQVLDDNKNASRARRNVEDVMQRSGTEIQGFLGLFSYNGPAIVQAVTNANKRADYKIVAFDAEPGTLQALEKGTVDATVVQKPYQFGYLSTKLLYLINRKGWTEARKEMEVPEDGIYDTGVEVITPANVKQYRENLVKLGVKSS